MLDNIVKQDPKLWTLSNSIVSSPLLFVFGYKTTEFPKAWFTLATETETETETEAQSSMYKLCKTETE